MVYLINDETLISIADAIREKTGISENIAPTDMSDLIKGIKTGDGIGYKVITSEKLFFVNSFGNLVDANTPITHLDIPMQFKGIPKVITVSVVEG